jgi:hypothetical protein
MDAVNDITGFTTGRVMPFTNVVQGGRAYEVV